jgi:uncharacterized protein YjbI with pentapeptide repeats
MLVVLYAFRMVRTFSLIGMVFAGLNLMALAEETGAAPAADEVREEISMRYLSNENFSGKDLGFTRFFRARMNGADFTGADLTQVTFEQTDLAGADFTKALFGAESKFYRVNMNGADFQSVDVGGATFDSVNMRGSDLQNSTGWGVLRSCNFAGADLRGADFSTVTEVCDRCVWKGAIINDSTKLPPGLDAEKAGLIVE